MGQRGDGACGAVGQRGDGWDEAGWGQGLTVPVDILSNGHDFVLSGPGDWTSTKEVVHWCKGCCATFEQAVDRVLGLLLLMSSTVLPVPSLNEWLSVWPLACDVAFGLCFHALLLDGIKFANGKIDVEKGAEEELSENELMCAPEDEKAFFEKMKNKRRLKCLKWIGDPLTLPSLLVFLTVCRPVLKLHYSLFKYAQQSPQGTKKSMLFNLCNFKESRVVHIISELTSMLDDSDVWAPLKAHCGEISQWPLGLWKNARNCILQLIASLERRLVWVFQKYPWKLVPLSDPDVPMTAKRKVADEFFAAGTCDLDPASKKIRDLLARQEDLFSEHWQSFLFHAFNKVVLSTAFVECIFAHFTKWLARPPKPWSTALLQAKHVSTSFKRTCQDKLNLAEPHEKVRAQLKRPEWNYEKRRSWPSQCLPHLLW